MCLTATLPSHAQNGAIAHAVSVSNIVIDGDLSDWPDDLPRNPISLVEYGEAPRDSSDFSAEFRVGFNLAENALYLALEVRDQSTVIDTSRLRNWNTQDGCELYVSVGGRKVIGMQVHGESIKNATANAILGPLFGGRVAYRRDAGFYRYEWRFDVAELSGGKKVLKENMAVGLDVVVNDMDEDGSFSWIAWGQGTQKYDSRDRVGTALLIRDAARSLGRVSGLVRWVDTSKPAARVPVRFTSTNQPDYSPRALTGEVGIIIVNGHGFDNG